MMPNKKAQESAPLSVLIVGGITLVVAVIILSVGAGIVTNLKDSTGARVDYNASNVTLNPTALYNITNSGEQGFLLIGNNFSTIAVIIALTVIILLIIGAVVLLNRNNIV